MFRKERQMLKVFPEPENVKLSPYKHHCEGESLVFCIGSCSPLLCRLTVGVTNSVVLDTGSCGPVSCRLSVKASIHPLGWPNDGVPFSLHYSRLNGVLLKLPR